MRAAENREALEKAEAAVTDLFARLGALFDHYPALVGFSVQEYGTLAKDRLVAALDGNLCIADVSLDGWPGDDASGVLCSVTQVMIEVLDERPELKQLLSGRTFARTLH